MRCRQERGGAAGRAVEVGECKHRSCAERAAPVFGRPVAVQREGRVAGSFDGGDGGGQDAVQAEQVADQQPDHLAIGETVILRTLSLSHIAIETPDKGRGGCSRVAVSPTAITTGCSSASWKTLSSYNTM